jgi:hypothetical protein
MGAEGRYEDWVYLVMLQNEWTRPESAPNLLLRIGEAHRPSSRAMVALLFWSYFETRIERLFQQALLPVPQAIREDLLTRYPSIGSRLDRLYKIVFGSTYWTDLASLGFGATADLLRRVQDRRNAFAHGEPNALDDSIVAEIVAGLKEEHESWIAVFNKRAARPTVVA